MLSDTIRMIENTVDDTVTTAQSDDVRATLHGMVTMLIHARANAWMIELDERESNKPEDLAHQGARYEASALDMGIEPLKFFLAWGWEVAINDEMVKDEEFSKSAVKKIQETDPEMMAMVNAIEARTNNMCENTIEETWLNAFLRKNLYESMKFYDDRVDKMRRLFTSFNTRASKWSRARSLHSFEISAMELYTMGLRLGPAMKDLEVLKQMEDES